MKKRVLIGCVGVAAAYLFLAAIMCSLYRRSQAIPWHEKYSVICHALGRTQEGDPLSNSYEAFLYNYNQGQRVFEADVQITSDGVMVLRHDWTSDLGQWEAFGWSDEERWAVTAEEFLSTPLYGKYTPLSLEDWFEIMKRYPNIYMVTDTKYSPDVEGQFQLFVNTAIENGYEDVLSRVIVQIYYREMYDEVAAVYPFENWIWTLYYIGYPGSQEVLDFMAEKEIPVLTMVSDWWDAGKQADLAGSGIKVYVHTVDDEEEARQRAAQGVSGIYTDDILPAAFGQWKEELAPSREEEENLAGQEGDS